MVQPWILNKVGDVGVYTNLAFHLGHPEGVFFGRRVASALAGLEALFQAAPMIPLAGQIGIRPGEQFQGERGAWVQT